MKLTHISVSNFLGVSEFDAELTRPVALIAGPNGSGKSSIQEAVRMALTGEAVRVELKKDYARLMREGAKNAVVQVRLEGGEASIVLPSGKRHAEGIEARAEMLPWVLDAQMFARLDANDRRAFLFGLFGLSADGPAVKKRLVDKGFGVERVDAIAPLLKAGFDAARAEAQAKAREAKAAWRTIAGEIWGANKSADWAAPRPAFDPAALSELEKRIAEAEAALDGAMKEIGAIESARRNRSAAVARLNELREKAGRYARIMEKLAHDEAELKGWRVKVDATRALAKGAEQEKEGLIHDLAWALDTVLQLTRPTSSVVEVSKPILERYIDEYGPVKRHDKAADEEQSAAMDARTSLPEYERALDLLQKAVENDRRDLAAADAAAKAIASAEAAIGAVSTAEELEAKEKRRAEISDALRGLRKQLEEMRVKKQQAEQAEAKTQAARREHESAIQWMDIAAALAPDGIPAEMLDESLRPINNILKSAAESSEWPQVEIRDDMGIRYGGRDYALISESEKWRADAMISWAIAKISGLNLLVLDRFDVLDLAGRNDLLFWFADLVEKDKLETALVFGTLKTCPSFDFVDSFWLGEK